MGVWDTYFSRTAAKGGNRRNDVLERQKRFLEQKLPLSLSYHHAIISGEHRELAIINSDDLNKKTLCSKPGEDLPMGGLVQWMNSNWLITEKDMNNELYTKCIMRRCNYLLKWIDESGEIVERWCIVEDGTKYLTGEYGDRDYVVTRGDTRVSVTLAKDDKSVKLNRKNRFIIDDPDSPSALAYELTKPFKLSGNYGDSGVFIFILQECNTIDSDNIELCIANYYDYFPRENIQQQKQDLTNSSNEDSSSAPERTVWF